MWAHSKCDLTNNLYNCIMTCQLMYSLLWLMKAKFTQHYLRTLPTCITTFREQCICIPQSLFRNLWLTKWILNFSPPILLFHVYGCCPPLPQVAFFSSPNPTAPLVCTAATHIALWLLLSYHSGICPLAKNCFPDLGHFVCLSGGFSDTISSWTLGLPLELFPSCLVCKVCLFHTSH